MKEKLKFAFGALITGAFLFALGYVGVKSIMKKRAKPPVATVPLTMKPPVKPPPTPEEKMQALAKKVSQNPLDAHLHFLLAEAYNKAGKKILALLEYRKSMEINPHSGDAEAARNWIEHETVIAKGDWGKNIGVRYKDAMQLESYTSLTGSLISITQAVAMKDQQFAASAQTTSLTPTQQAGAPTAGPGGQLPSFLPSGVMYVPVPMTGYAQPMQQPGTIIPGSPQTGPGIIVPKTPPPAGYAPSQPPAGYTPLGGK